jgi:toxin ParE1/3/4
MRLVWTHFAIADREAIFGHIEAHNPVAAIHVDAQIALTVKRLLEFPESGRVGRITGTRELVIPRTPYIAAYVSADGKIRILRILHGAQIWPDNIYREE